VGTSARRVTVSCVSITEDAEVAPPVARRANPRRPGRARRASPWWWLVGGSALLLVLVAVGMGAWWIASSETRMATYRVVGTLTAIELDLDAADVEIVGGARAAEVRRTDEFAFGRRPRESRALTGSVLRIRSRCADTVVGTCRSAYRIAVPDNVQVTARTSSGRVAISGLNGSARIATGSGPIVVSAFCGFALSATSASGDVRATADCSPDRLQLRAGSGDVLAAVPAGRYQLEALSDSGTVSVEGVLVADDASFRVEAVSASGDVTVEGGR
jgi:Putative adhesin